MWLPLVLAWHLHRKQAFDANNAPHRHFDRQRICLNVRHRIVTMQRADRRVRWSHNRTETPMADMRYERRHSYLSLTQILHDSFGNGCKIKLCEKTRSRDEIYFLAVTITEFQHLSSFHRCRIRYMLANSRQFRHSHPNGRDRDNQNFHFLTWCLRRWFELR